MMLPASMSVTVFASVHTNTMESRPASRQFCITRCLYAQSCAARLQVRSVVDAVELEIKRIQTSVPTPLGEIRPFAVRFLEPKPICRNQYLLEPSSLAILQISGRSLRTVGSPPVNIIATAGMGLLRKCFITRRISSRVGFTQDSGFLDVSITEVALQVTTVGYVDEREGTC